MTEELKARLERLRAEHDELEKALPAHGLKPAHLLRIEELEDEIESLEARLAVQASSQAD